MNTVIVGCGYVGQQVARAELARGNTVQALVRSSSSANNLSAAGIHADAVDLDTDPVKFPFRFRGTHVYYFAPPPRSGQVDSRIRNFLDAIEPGDLPTRIVYISTTGIYGDCGEDWVSEDRVPDPKADRAKRRLDAERALHDWSISTGVARVVLRVPGIYGPGKIPLARIKKGAPSLNETESAWSNRVHVDDLVQSCIAAMDHAHPLDTYNISDGHPSTMTDYFNHIADAAGLPRPPQISMSQAKQEFSSEMLSYLSESKRIDNSRMREHLGVTLKYPTLERGLAAVFADNENN
jgi:nucleoside-diphosphate-sugar epimerase